MIDIVEGAHQKGEGILLCHLVMINRASQALHTLNADS
jgi:hypothetical protein